MVGNYTLRWNVLHNACGENNVCVLDLFICSAMKRTRYIRSVCLLLYLSVTLFLLLLLLLSSNSLVLFTSSASLVFFSMFRSRSFDFCFYFTTSLTTISFCAHGYSICWPVCCMRLLLPKYSNVFELLTEQSYSVYHTFNFMYDVSFFFFIHSTRYWRRKRKRDEHSKCEKANENSNNTNNNITVFFLKNQL